MCRLISVTKYLKIIHRKIDAKLRNLRERERKEEETDKERNKKLEGEGLGASGGELERES